MDYRINWERLPMYMYIIYFDRVTELRDWVEENSRVNYPIKACLLRMIENGHLLMDDQCTCFWVSWYSFHVDNIVLNLFVHSWSFLISHVTTYWCFKMCTIRPDITGLNLKCTALPRSTNTIRYVEEGTFSCTTVSIYWRLSIFMLIPVVE